MLQNAIFITFPPSGLVASLASNAPHKLLPFLSWGWLFTMTRLRDDFQQREHLSSSIPLISVLIRCDVVGIVIINEDLGICTFCLCHGLL